MNRRVLLGVLVGAAGAAVTLVRAEDRPYIGVATMLPDGIIHIELHLSISGGGVADGFKDYQPDDPYYQEVLDHIGGLKPGESKPVRPWPDNPAAKR
jgi:hypothetical protein